MTQDHYSESSNLSGGTTFSIKLFPISDEPQLPEGITKRDKPSVLYAPVV